MPKTSLPSIAEIKQQFPKFAFAEHEVFHWSPKDNCVYYSPAKLQATEGVFQLLHEISHAVCGHQYYTSAVQLLKIEVEAWEKAKTLAAGYGLTISPEHIERCLDSYRDWLHLRSTCPTCETIALEVEANRYHCFNCLQKWKAPSDQRSRRYRAKVGSRP